VVAFTDAAATDAKRWSVPLMVLADLRPAAVQVFHLQSALEPRIAKVEEGLAAQATTAAVDRNAVVAANAANASMIGGLLHAQTKEQTLVAEQIRTEAKARADALELRFEERMRAMIATLQSDAKAQAAVTAAAAERSIEAVRVEARQLAVDNAALRTALEQQMSTRSAELQRENNALRDELQREAKSNAAAIAALQTENAELKRQLKGTSNSA
jgi:hypothetical protein